MTAESRATNSKEANSLFYIVGMEGTNKFQPSFWSKILNFTKNHIVNYKQKKDALPLSKSTTWLV
jgi:hypothetical protein